jgi:hypothetical protein
MSLHVFSYGRSYDVLIFFSKKNNIILPRNHAGCLNAMASIIDMNIFRRYDIVFIPTIWTTLTRNGKLICLFWAHLSCTCPGRWSWGSSWTCRPPVSGCTRSGTSCRPSRTPVWILGSMCPHTCTPGSAVRPAGTPPAEHNSRSHKDLENRTQQLLSVSRFSPCGTTGHYFRAL